MYLIPLSHIESVELVIHALRMAGGEVDCRTCPASKVCMKQCLSIANAVQTMLDDGSLPTFDRSDEDEGKPVGQAAENPKKPKGDKPSLKVIK